MKLRVAAALFTIATLAACETQQQAQDRIIEQARSTCRSYGMTEGTAAFSQCVMQVDNMNRQNQMAASAALLGMSQQYRPSQPMYQVQPTNCTTRRVAGALQTSCY